MDHFLFHIFIYLFPLLSVGVSQTFSQATYTATVNQNAVAGHYITTVECSGEGVVYSINSSSPSSVASISPSTGDVSLSVAALDVSLGIYTISLRCHTTSDGFATALLEIERVEENEFSPEFSDGDSAVTISEARDIEADPNVGQFTATDDDLGTFGSITYSLVGTQSSGLEIDSETGIITLTASLDYDTNPIIIVLVRASNPSTESGDVRFDAISLTINVVDVNDEIPLFNQTTYSAVVSETTPTTPRPDPGFLTVLCTDLDSPDSNITYASTSDSAPFQIDQSTGSLSLTADLDYETTTSFSFTVGCWDNGSPNLTSSADVDIVVGSVNEGHPTLTSPVVQTVHEGSETGTVISTYTATDVDDGPDGVITFTLTTDGPQFLDINLTTGVVYVSAPDQLDFDTLPLSSPSAVFYRYTFAVTACDTHPPSADCEEKTNQVLYILGVNEDSPEFSASTYSVSYPENTAAGTTVATASCSDSDRGTGRLCHIEFDESTSSGVTDAFYLDDDSGEVVSLISFDYESETRYAFELVCSDSGDDGNCDNGGSVKTDIVSVDIEIEPLNDNEPLFTGSSFTFNVSRTTPDDRRTVGVASANDEDDDEGGELEYTLQSNGFFDITNEGNVQIFNSVFNYSQDFFSLNVFVTDGEFNDSALVIIYLTDGNLNRPQFVSGSRAIEVSELSSVGTSIISLSCRDTDTGVNGDIRYSITAGNTNDAFEIDDVTGEVRVNRILILPQNSSNEDFTLTITCEDRGVPVFSDLASVLIRVYQDDSLPPTFPNDTIIAFISEDAELNDYVVTVEAEDLDSEELRYVFQDLSVPGAFTIGVSTGEIIVSGPLDREVTSVYTATVVATEERQTPGPERSDNTSLIIYIRDVNDNSPSCNPSFPSTNIDETHAVGSPIISLNCTDPDTAENGAISYSLSNDFGVLAISSSGVIFLNQSLSDTDQNTLRFDISVTDGGTDPNEVTLQATVFINSVNRHVPAFTNLPNTIQIGEDQAIQMVFFSVHAEDSDRGSFGEISYGIQNSTTSDDIGLFSNTGGLYLNRKLNYFQRNEYVLNISAADSNFTVFAELTIEVVDVNEYSPECTQPSFTTQIQEGLPAGQILSASLSCTDDDQGSNGDIVYSITSGNEEGAFEVFSDGSLRTLSELDFDNGTQRYELTINVSDSGSPSSRSVEVGVAVVVEAVNEFAPVIEGAPYMASVVENSGIGESVLQLRVSDGDSSQHAHGHLDYEIIGLMTPVFQFTGNGELQVAGEIDREEEGSYSFNVTVSDQGTPSLSAEAVIDITVTDVDDNGPEFTEDIYVVILNGTAEEGTYVTTVECTDRDDGINAGIEYSLVEGSTDASYFDIDSTGIITVDGDLPVSDIYSISVVCIGTGPSTFSDTTVVSIQVLVDSNITFSPSSSYFLSVPEDDNIGTELLTVEATSSTGADLSYDLLTSDSPFAIGEETGVLRLRTTLDYETTRTYTLQVRASDDGNPPNFGDAVIQLSVMNVNDETPVIMATTTSLTIQEETEVTIPIAQYNCSDEDDGEFGEVEFEILSGNDDDLFSITTSGSLQLREPLDYETATSHSLEVVCEDGGSPPQTDTITVTISVTPINDHPPIFPDDPIGISVSENLPSGSLVGAAIMAVDGDLAPHGNIRYSITTGNTPRTFALSEETGQLSLVQGLDYETTMSYTFEIVARDSGGLVVPSWTIMNDTAIVVVTVLDYNDNSPYFDSTTYSGTISENALNGDQVSLDNDISCLDQDSDVNGQVSLSIEDSPFSVQSSGLVLVSASEELDFEMQQLYILTVSCVDGGTPSQMTTVSLVITLQDVNEFGPQFNESSYSFSVSESNVVGTSVGEVSASDLDAGDAGTITYTIVTSDVPFDINPSDGTISLASSLDYETQQTSYIFQVEASDLLSLSDTATVIVVVENEDDNRPTFTQSVYYFEVRENVETDTQIGQISCTDADDSADNIQISYVVDAAVPFSVNSNGRISVTEGLNLESTPRYTFKVNCTDSSFNVAQTTLSINILPYNDFHPVFQGNLPYSTELAENPSLGTSVFDVTALDDDHVAYNDITYSFSSGNDGERFTIDPTSGVVTVSEAIDREVEEEYVLTVVARNDISEDDESGSPALSATTTLTITITDINDNAPVITPSNVSVLLQVSVSSNATIVDLDCSDRDAGDNGDTVFSISSLQFSERFQISSSGVLRTTDLIEDDVVVTVTCTDQGTPQRSSSARILIETVTMNEHAPIFTGPTLRMLEVREDAAVGEEVSCFTATDADGPDSPDGLLQYYLTATGTDSRFSIQRTTGCIFVALALDYDETDFYGYTVTVEDMGDPQRSSSITVEITILDTIRDPPEVQGTYARSLLEGLTAGTHVVDFLCEDRDDEDVIQYSIIEGNTDGLVSIDPDTGRIEVASGQVLDYETSTSHTLLVQCQDTYNLTDSAEVFLTIIPVNEFTPSFSVATFSVPEHSIPGTVVANIQWEDLDSGRDGDVEFEILSGDPETLFEVTSSGQLLVRGNLDRETQDMFELMIKISDLSLTDSRFSTNNITVILTDINDKQPQFDREMYNFGPLEGDEEPGHYLGTVSCSDDDLGVNAETEFIISSTNTDASLFSINSTGDLIIVGDLRDREFDNITFFVQCRDSGSIPMFGTALVIIPVQEENLFPPVFLPTTYSTTVPEDTSIVSEVLLTVSATDMDEGVNGRVQYSLQDDFNNTFFIDDSLGDLTLLRSLDFEETQTYNLIAIVTDGTADSTVRLSDSANVTIDVSGVNEFSPYCPDPIYVTIINRTTIGTIIDLSCEDDDAGNDGELDYIITGGNEGNQFDLSPNGMISIPTAIQPPPEIDQFSLYINVSDRGDSSLTTEIEVIAIYSFDNLHAPMFNETSYTVYVSETTEVGTIIATLNATDSDRSLQGIIQYSLQGTTGFRIDSESGQLFLSSPLDYEALREASFTATAEDSDPYSPKSGSSEVKVIVLNENDDSPVCTQQLYSISIPSTAVIGESVLTLNCSDVDGDPISYSLSSSLTTFDIHPTSGVVSVQGDGLTAGTTTVFDITVSDDVRSIEVSVSVGVQFSNTAPPVLTHDYFNFTISEDSSLLSIVGSLTATDEDSSDLVFTAASSTLSDFYISPESGDILLTVPLDYETTTSYTFDVIVNDEGSHDGTNSLSDTATVTVSVENTNDNIPQFSNGGIYGAIVSKNTAEGTTVVSISCTDGDASPYGSPSVSSDDLNSDVPFSLTDDDDSEYNIILTQPLLDSTSAAYFLNITCTDGGGESVDGQVFIFVPEPDAPSFSETIYEWLLSENTPTGDEFTDVMATSSDGSDVSYDIADGNSDDIFYIDPSTGVVSLVATLDYETQQTHGLIVRARDEQDRESRVLLLVKVLDINDQVPLTPPSARLEVEQNSPPGYPVGTLECSDGDAEEGTVFNFTFIPANDLFSVDQYGVVRLEGELDSTPVHVLPVVCSEADMPEATSTGVVTVEVIFVNENSPEFEFSSYVFSIREDVSTLTYVGTLEAEDDDVGSFGEISYSITDGNPDQFFIEAGTGRIGVLTSLDRETTDFYSLTISAVDGGSAATDSSRRNGTTQVEIMIEDANDNTPTTTMSSYVESITTDHPIHSSVLSITCTDPDEGSAGEIVYSLDPQTTPFSVQTNGTILLDVPQSDQTVHTFDIVCTDRGSPPLSSSSLVTIIVSAVELEAPAFDSSSYNVTVSENEPIQTTIITVHATPSDASVNIGYQIESGNDGDAFHVDPISGDVIIRSPLDAGEQQFYTLTIRATNTGRSPLSSFVTLDVLVTDVNDHSPVFFTPFYTASINETTSLLTPVAQVSCTDEDITAEISYSIRGGSGLPSVFNITQDGVIVTSGPIDYETETVYNLMVECSDGGLTPRSAESTVRVEILPVNEYLPMFSQMEYPFSAEENSFGSLIGTLSAQDNDAGRHGEVTFLLQDPGNFSVVFVDPSTGDVLVSNNLDYENRDFWNLTVIARDGAGAESFVSLFVSVINVNDVLPVIIPATSLAIIPHDRPSGYPVQSFSCTDGDGTRTSLSITQGNEQDYVFLNSLNQLVWTGMAEHLLNSIVISLTLECMDEEASDPQTALAYSAITIQVGDNLPPTFSHEIYEYSVAENSSPGLNILTVSATSGSNTVLYSLDDLFVSLPFGLDPLTGVVSLTSSLDRENSSSYVFPVYALDNVTGAVGVALVDITVVDVNDNSPVISPNMLSLTLSESMAVDLPFYVFQCTDVDEGENGDTEFSVNPTDPFRVSEEGNLFLATSLNFEEHSQHDITVVCSDNGDPILSSTAIVQIQVSGTNEHQPVFSPISYTFNLTEAAALGTQVGVVSATDDDDGTQLVYQLVGGSGFSFFTINSLGEISTSFIPTNATLHQILELVVEVSDGLLTSSAVVEVMVEDVNEPPRFPSTGVLALWSTSAPIGSTIIEVVCFDTDTTPNAQLVLNLNSNPSSLPLLFSTLGSDGVVTGRVAANASISAGTYTFSLLCSDGELDTIADVTLRVEGVNQPPLFTHGDLSLSIPEPTTVGTPLVNVMATDPEGTEVVYSITSGTGLGTFAIDDITGLVSLALTLDFEETQTYQFTVTATDSSRFNRESSSVGIFVYVQNVNDVPPVLTPSGSIVRTLLEDSTTMSAIQSFTCVDPEESETFLSLTPSFHLLNSPFSVTDSTVILQGEVDYERERNYSIIITCTDAAFTGGDQTFQETASLFVHILPVNLHSPIFISILQFTVEEDATTGSELGRVVATDADNRDGPVISYTLQNHLDIFVIGLESGIITLRTGLDFEEDSNYTLSIEASDNDNTGDSVSPQTTVADVLVLVSDINDNSPLCENYLITVGISTGTYTNELLTEIQCSDRDSEENGRLIYSFIESSLPVFDAGELQLDPSTGELRFSGSLTMAETVVVDVNVSDSGQPRREARVTVTIQIQSSSLTEPRFNTSTFRIDIPENTEISSVIFPGTNLISSLHNPIGDPVTYTIRDNSAYGRTFVINSATGDISVSGESQLDYDLGIREYSLIVEAFVASFIPTAVVDVFLSDVNDNPPEFTQGTYVGSVLENEAVGTVVSTVTAIDIDSGNNAMFQYYTNSIAFEVDPDSGEVTTLVQFDREALPTTSLTITAIDMGNPPLSSTTVVSVTIEDKNDVAPRFLQDLYIININNLSPPGTSLLTFTLEDPDIVGNFTFRFVSGPSQSLFTISPYMGILERTSETIPENHLLVYRFVVEVNDGIRTATTDVIVNIVTVTTATLHILENQEHSYDLKGFLTERGFGFGADSTIFSFLGGNELMDFTISSDGILSTMGLDRESIPLYHLNINVTDLESELSANVLVTVEVEDVNDHAPIFPLANYVFNISETTFVSSHSLGRVEAVDHDDPATANARLQYSLVVPNNDGFSITFDGEIFVIGTYNREETSRYSIIVRAEDFGEPDQEYGYTTVIVNILDINDNNPQFFPPDVVEFFIQIDISEKEQVVPGTALDQIVAILPVVNVTVQLEHFVFFDPDESDRLRVSLRVLEGGNKTELIQVMTEETTTTDGRQYYIMIATDFIKPDDDGTILQISLADDEKEDNPIIRNVTILVNEITEPPTTPPEVDTPPTKGVEPPTTGFFDTEIGIAVIVVLALVLVAIILLFGCLLVYCYVRYKRNKDPLNARDRFISVAQRIQGTERTKRIGAPWEYGDYSDMDLLEHTDMNPEDQDVSFVYKEDYENESTFISEEEPHSREMGTPEPFSTGTSMLSSIPNISQSYREEDEEDGEDEESVRTYTMGPILRAMLEEFEKGDSVLKKPRQKKKSHSSRHDSAHRV